MARKIHNIGASVRARLLQRAQDDGTDFQILLIRYSLERLLYRLSLSQHRDRFVLKGAMLLATWINDPFRPTRDLDLLGHGDSSSDAIADAFRAICSVAVDDDGVMFDVGNLQAFTIRDGQVYGGIRVRTTALIDKAKVPIQIDVGFGDAITPAPVDLTYPALLGGSPPLIKAYPVETVIAEKFEAMVSLGLANTRLKDFYDLWFIAQTFTLERTVLADAMRRTFERRNTSWPTEIPAGLTDAFVTARAPQWRAFLTRDQLSAAPGEFAAVVAALRTFLLPVIADSAPNLTHWRTGGPWRAAD